MRDTLRTHSWQYFDLHANQRMPVFNFYLIFVGLLTGGLAKVFEMDFPLPERAWSLDFSCFWFQSSFGGWITELAR